MSLSNLNVNVLPCYPVGSRDTGDVSFTKIHTTFPIVEAEDGERKIKELFFGLLFNGMQDRKVEVDADEIFSFDANYEVRIRLAELSTGQCIDLDKFETKEKFEKIAENIDGIDVFRFTHICFFEDLSLPKNCENGDFIVKILVKQLTGDDEADNNKPYMIQSVYHLKIV